MVKLYTKNIRESKIDAQLQVEQAGESVYGFLIDPTNGSRLLGGGVFRITERGIWLLDSINDKSSLNIPFPLDKNGGIKLLK